MINQHEDNIWSKEVALNQNYSQEMLDGVFLSLVAPIIATIETTINEQKKAL